MRDNLIIETLKYFLNINDDIALDILINRRYAVAYNSISCPEILNTWFLFANELVNDGTLELDTDLFDSLQEFIEEENEDSIRDILIDNNCALDKKHGIAFWFYNDIEIFHNEIG